MATERPAARYDNHRLGTDQFDQIAAGSGDPETIRKLFDGEMSRRLLLIRTLLKHLEAASQPDALPTAADVWDLLSAVQRRSPADLVATLMYPAVGTWLSRVLRLISRRQSGSIPMWVYAGKIHSVAFAAAVRAGVDCETALPVVNGGVMLPSLGLVRFPGGPEWTVATARHADHRTSVRCDGTTVVLPDEPAEDAPGWWGLRQVTAPGDARFRIYLDDIDPHRNLADPVAPERLPDRNFDSWSRSLCRAWTQLERTWPAYAAGLASGLNVITPLPDDAGNGVVRSASTGDAFGAAVLTFTDDKVTLAGTLVHEFQHTKLGGILHLFTLHEDVSENELYAPWRPDPRPFGGLIQGIYAFLGIAEFWCRQQDDPNVQDARLAQFEFAYARRQVSTALRSVAGSARLTPLGQRFVDGMRASVRRLHTVPVSADAARAAWAAATDHRTTWLLRNIVPDPDLVSSLATRWRDNEATPVGLGRESLAVTRPDTSGDWLNARQTLYRMRLSGSARYLSAREGTTDVGSIVSGATDADVVLFEDAPNSLDAYRSQIQRGRPSAEHQDREQWAGLAIAAAAARNPAWRMLCREPHLVRAIHRTLVDTGANPDPVDLADWLGRALRPIAP